MYNKLIVMDTVVVILVLWLENFAMECFRVVDCCKIFSLVLEQWKKMWCKITQYNTIYILRISIKGT